MVLETDQLIKLAPDWCVTCPPLGPGKVVLSLLPLLLQVQHDAPDALQRPRPER